MNKPYDDDTELRHYLELYGKQFQTDAERRGLELCGWAYRIDGFLSSNDAASQEIGNKAAAKLATLEIQLDAAAALAIGFRAYREQVLQRLIRDASSNLIPINRCPRCQRIVRTPLAKQCLWCLNDWHEARQA